MGGGKYCLICENEHSTDPFQGYQIFESPSKWKISNKNSMTCVVTVLQRCSISIRYYGNTNPQSTYVAEAGCF
jgi:hypothetical protein